jgi:hypothetical protein
MICAFLNWKLKITGILSVFLDSSLLSVQCITLPDFALSTQMWTKEETNELFDLCERFDLRFVVIADRFSSSRTVEELKDRYYSGMSLFNNYYILHPTFRFLQLILLIFMIWRLHEQKCDTLNFIFLLHVHAM